MSNFHFKRYFLSLALALFALVGFSRGAQAATYYISTTGNDQANGSAGAPFKTFAHAWSIMQAGDTLLIYDGTYTEPIQPLVAGVEGRPITIKAINDGKVIIDGQGTTIPLKLGDTWPGDNRSWLVVEGIVAKNGTEGAVRIRGDHVTLRRVSAYNADLRLNSSVIVIGWSDHVLLEDVLAAGTGRKNILIFTSEYVTVRRAFTQWVGWDGNIPASCAMGWPAGNGINPYNSKYVTIENVVVTGPMADAALRITANHESVYSPGMQILGSIAIGAGLNADGSRHEYVLPPDPQCTVPEGGPPYYAAAWGMGVYGQGDVPGPIFRDVLTMGNAGWGFASLKPSGVGVHEGLLDHATVVTSNRYPGQESERNVLGTYNGFTVTNSKIPGFQDGQGARLTNRYVDGVLTDQPLLPWPMEGRAQAELSLSVNAVIANAIQAAGSGGGGNSGGSTPVPSPTPRLSPTPVPTPIPGATPTPIASDYRVNVPLLNVTSGDPGLDANNWSVFSLGKVSGGGNYADIRLIGAQDGLRVRAHVLDANAQAGDVIALELKGVTNRVAYPATTGWEIENRCDSAGCHGWTATARLPWSDFGGAPQAGTSWMLRATVDDADGSGTARATWPPTGSGSLYWGLPDYAGRTVAASQVLQSALSADSMVGGGTECGAGDGPNFFSGWGNRNWGSSPYVNVEMTWDIADWQCYSKYYAAWSLGAVPAGSVVVSATVEMRLYGNGGTTPGETGTTVFQVQEVAQPWNETTITWDNAPTPAENVARTAVAPLPSNCQPSPGTLCRPGIAYLFDVTEIVKRARADGRNWASVALYTAAGQNHSGKYLSSREGQEAPVVRVAYVPASALTARLYLPQLRNGASVAASALDESDGMDGVTVAPFVGPVTTVIDAPATDAPVTDAGQPLKGSPPDDTGLPIAP